MRAAVLQGDSLELLRQEPDARFDLILTSPPYYRLRSYLASDDPDKARELGQETSVGQYVERLRAVCREMWRVLKPTGSLWLVLGDSYSVGGSGGTGRSSQLVGNGHAGRTRQSPYLEALAAGPRIDRRERGVAPKSLLGVPWRVAMALIDDGWRLRNDIIWNKRNALPTSVRDRFKNAHEHVFFFAKAERYWCDLDAVKMPLAASTLQALRRPPGAGGGLAMLPRIGGNRAAGYGSPVYSGNAVAVRTKTAELRAAGHAGYQEHRQPIPGGTALSLPAGGSNPGDVWDIPTQPSREHHFAGFPSRLCERIIRFACPLDGVVLDPFCGSGTTLLTALRLGRCAVGYDLSAEYAAMTRRRIAPLMAQRSLFDGPGLEHPAAEEGGSAGEAAAPHRGAGGAP